jgi:effector-binding domain-containing protein
MLSEPKVIEREAQPYLAIRKIVRIPFGTVASKTLADLARWMRKRGIERADAPFFKYNIIDMATALEIDFGAPTLVEEAGDETVLSGTLPAGRYASLVHTGPYKGLMDANGTLLTGSGPRSSNSTRERPPPATCSAAGWRSIRPTRRSRRTGANG